MNAHQLGYAGLVPFVVLSLLAWVVHAEAAPYVHLALVGYGAVIVSFLGGIHWGIAFSKWQAAGSHLLWGVLPSLLAWAAVLMPAYAAAPLLAALLVLCYWVDRSLYPAAGLQYWLVLRLRLTVVAVLSLLVAAARM
jgi:hypothetical protein